MQNDRILKIELPDYTIDKKPSYITLGRKVDKIIESSLPEGIYYERVLSIDDHPNLDIDELSKIILETGTDRYDKNRKSVCHEQFEIYDYDLHLGSFEIKDGKIVISDDDEQPTLFGEAIYNFYEHTPLDRGKRLRLDLIIVYNTNAFEKAQKLDRYKENPNHRFDCYLYKFKDGFDRSKAVVKIYQILR